MRGVDIIEDLCTDLIAKTEPSREADELRPRYGLLALAAGLVGHRGALALPGEKDRQRVLIPILSRLVVAKDIVDLVLRAEESLSEGEDKEFARVDLTVVVGIQSLVPGLNFACCPPPKNSG